MRLGGIDLAFDHHLVGHSDADVLLHAITDAILGAAALGDIGELFPDDDPDNRQRDSREMLEVAHRQVRAEGFVLMNVDCIVFAEQPKLSPYKPALQQAIAEVLEVTPQQVGIKAKTGERVGPVGRQEAVQAQCVALLELRRGGRPGPAP